MRDVEAGVVGGIVAGALMSATMILGRRHGLLSKTLDEYSEDWLDRNFSTRWLVGTSGTTALEMTNHMAASAAFGAGFAATGLHRAVNPTVTGLLYGAALYVINIAGIAPRIGITSEQREPAHLVAQRLGLHMLFGAVMSVTAAALSRPLWRHRP